MTFMIYRIHLEILKNRVNPVHGLTQRNHARIVSRFGLISLNQTKQRPVGSVGVEALLDQAVRSVDNYCGVNGTRSNAYSRRRKLLAINATPQKSFGLREATIHTRRVNSEIRTSLN